ncbi:unannotated protein [freshwater metagenome]|uniref:Unannotated protein n=1 Tax=freshwater metagenome TaxID=449393 RepID=A0A6J6G4Q0_9ZZZZ
MSHDQPTRAENSVRGRISGISHFGDVLQYVVTAGERDLLVLCPRSMQPRPALGDDVWCTWAAEEVYLFSARQAGVVMAEGVDA